eukprot:GHVR01083393.1.p1 GENE.GHVR01083393.1~~GHVR01083393.1.p1  ORF type:complete len:158 (+),score=15.75 GHVR01083393.1:1636-2109(+)
MISEAVTFSSDAKHSSFFLYQADSVDNVKTSVRVLGESGNLAAAGRLELRTQSGWGSVCKLGGSAGFSARSATVACKELGYLYGEVEEEGCSDVDGEYVCASSGYPVAAAGIECTQDHGTLNDCNPQGSSTIQGCDNHANDVAIHCSNKVNKSCYFS